MFVTVQLDLVLIILLLHTVEQAECNVRFVCPRPTCPSSDQDSVGSMSPPSFTGEEASDTVVTDLDPGLFTVYFEETKFEKDSLFRISLIDISEKGQDINNNTNSSAGDVNQGIPQCMLLDHIPHNNHAIITERCAKGGNDFPVGICNGSSYYITVKIPDVACEDCLLILEQVIPLPNHEACSLIERNYTTNDSDCMVYTSTARVRIRPSEKGSTRDLSHCTNYLVNLPGDWPYRTQDMYKTEEGSILTFDWLHQSLHIEIPNSLNLGPVEKVEIWQNITVIWNTTVHDNTGITVSVIWWNLSDLDQERLKDGLLVLNIIGSKKSLAADILFIEQHFSEGRYRALYDVYSPTGWLVAPSFLGPQAKDPAAALPAGLCVPKTVHYVANLQSVHMAAHGILSMTVLESRAYITVVLHVAKEVIQSIIIKGPDLIDISPIEIKVPPSSNGVVQAAFDISDQMQYISTVRFFKLVEVNTDKEDAVLVGDLEEGMYTVLRDENGEIHGMGSFQFTQGQWLKAEFVLNDLSDTVQSAILNGPGSELLDISRETSHCTQEFCCLDAIHHELSSELVLYLIRGQATMRVITPHGNVTGQVLSSPLRYCQLFDGTCHSKYLRFSISGIGMEERSEVLSLTALTSGWSEADAFVLDRANVLHYCVELSNINMTGKYFTASLLRSGSKLDEVPFKALADKKNSYLACNSVFLGDDILFITSLEHTTHEWVTLVVSEGEDNFLSKDLPSISRGDCILSKIHIVAQDKSYWSAESAPLEDIHAVVSDHLKFIFDKNTTLYLMKSKADYEVCNFASAEQLTVLDTLGEKAFNFYPLRHTGKLYFADSNACNTSQPLKLTVHVTEGISLVQDNSHDERCRKSVYQMWRSKQLESWSEPEVSGPILIGLVVGLSSAAAFLLWQGIRMKRIPDAFRGTSDSVFVRF